MVTAPFTNDGFPKVKSKLFPRLRNNLYFALCPSYKIFSFPFIHLFPLKTVLTGSQMLFGNCPPSLNHILSDLIQAWMHHSLSNFAARAKGKV